MILLIMPRILLHILTTLVRCSETLRLSWLNIIIICNATFVNHTAKQWWWNRSCRPATAVYDGMLYGVDEFLIEILKYLEKTSHQKFRCETVPDGWCWNIAPFMRLIIWTATPELGYRFTYVLISIPQIIWLGGNFVKIEHSIQTTLHSTD